MHTATSFQAAQIPRVLNGFITQLQQQQTQASR